METQTEVKVTPLDSSIEIESDPARKRSRVWMMVSMLLVLALVGYVIVDLADDSAPTAFKQYHGGVPKYQLTQIVEVPYNVQSVHGATGTVRLYGHTIRIAYRISVGESMQEPGVPTVTVIPLKAEVVRSGVAVIDSGKVE